MRYRLRISVFLISGFMLSGCVLSLNQGWFASKIDSAGKSPVSVAYFNPRAIPKTFAGESVIVLFHPAGTDGEEYLDGWMDEAKKGKYFFAAPTIEFDPVYWTQGYQDQLFSELERLSGKYQLVRDGAFFVGSSFGANYGFEAALAKPGKFHGGIFLNGSLGRYLDAIRRFPGRTIDAPVLLVWGSEDPNLDPEGNEKARAIFEKAGIKNISFEIIQGLGHAEDPFVKKELMDLIDAKLNKMERA